MKSSIEKTVRAAASRPATPHAAGWRRLLRRCALPAVAGVAALLAPAVALHADSISFKSGTTTQTTDVQIKGFEDGNLVFATGTSGRITNRALDSITVIKATGEPALSAAEEAYAASKWEDAARGYDRVLTSSDKPWAKARATVRLIDAAGKSGQFPLQAKAFIVLSGINLNDATKNKPPVPKEKPEQVNAALEDVKRALANAAMRADQKSLLTTFQAELLNAVGKGEEAAKILTNTPPPANTSSTGGSTPNTGDLDPTKRGINAARALAIANQNIQQKNYPAAIQAIEHDKASFTDPAQQVQALWALAVAKEQTAGTDSAKLQDAAIAYMRVVAHFEDKPEFADNVAGALMKTAEIEERLNKPEEAMMIYDQIAKDSKLQNKWGASATKKLNDLKAKTK